MTGVVAVVAAVAVGLIAGRSDGHKLLILATAIPFLLMLVRDVRRTLLVVVVFDTAFQWDKNFGYNTAAANLGALGGLNVSATTIALGGLYLLWFAELATRRASFNRGTLRAALPLILYVGITAVSIFAAANKGLAADEVAMLVQTLLLFVYVGGALRTRSDIRFLAGAIVACLMIESILTLLLPYIGSQKLLGIATYAQTDPSVGGGGTDSRFGGTIGGPNTAAAFFSLLIVPSIAMVSARVTRRTKRIAIVAAMVATLALILTVSRGGFLALVVSFLFLALTATKRGWISPKIPIAFAIVLVLLALPLGGRLANRLTKNDQGSASGRVPLIHLAVSVIRDHPVLGVGANNLGLTFPKYAGPQYDQDWIYTVHNKYLLVWAEAGIGALVAFLWFLGSTLRRGWSLWRTGDPLVAPIALGLTAGVIGQMVHMNVDIFQSRPQVQVLWLVAALLVAMQNARLEDRQAVA
jgi:O-antigen ligase